MSNENEANKKIHLSGGIFMSCLNYSFDKPQYKLFLSLMNCFDPDKNINEKDAAAIISKYLHCTGKANDKSKYTESLNDSKKKKAFDQIIKTPEKYTEKLERLSFLKKECFKEANKLEISIGMILKLIIEDVDIENDELFYINENGHPSTKKTIANQNEFYLPS
ncbi:MAG: hypothetical protein IJ583_04195, partial [Firmicutes bacterium]|nr:hypothetical protein [Bacillota bacterium]